MPQHTEFTKIYGDCMCKLFFLVFRRTAVATRASAVTAATALALLFAHDVANDHRHNESACRNDDQNFPPTHDSPPSSSLTATSASGSLSSMTSVFASGCFLFQNTIPTTAPAIAAAKMNTVHHQLPTR